jgi:hypothetical protein
MSALSLLHQQLAHWQAHGVMPMRSGLEHVVQENPYSVTLRRSSSKGEPKTRWAESMLEYDFFCVLDFDWRVEKYQEQPVVIPWRTPGGQYRRYTPDVLVKFRPMEFQPDMSHLRSTIFEIKPYKVLKESWPKLRPKVRGVQRSLEGTCVPFKVVTERQLRPAFVENVKFLLDYDIKRMVCNNRITPAQYERLMAVGKQIPIYRTTTPREILDSLTFDVMEQAYLVPWVWHMLRIGELQADLIDPLTVDTPVWARGLRRPRAKWMTKDYDWYK